MLAHQACHRHLVARQLLVHLRKRHAATIHPVAHQTTHGLDCEQGGVPLALRHAVDRGFHVLRRQLERLRERLALDHGADGACAAGHGQAPAALEAHLHEHRVGNGVVHHGEQAQRHLAALRLAHHALHVEALGLASVLEVRHDGEHRFRIAFHPVVQLGLIHVLRANERTVVRLVIDITALIRFVERDFLLVRHIDTPYS